MLQPTIWITYKNDKGLHPFTPVFSSTTWLTIQNYHIKLLIAIFVTTLIGLTKFLEEKVF